MELPFLLDFIIHIDVHLEALIETYSHWIYVIIFGIIFLETGVVVTPFLPGDSLLFALGAFAAQGALSFPILIALCISAAIIGDSVNYWAGNRFGRKIFYQDSGWWLNKKYLEHAERFYEKHGRMTIILARFMPIVRTFAPFVAGMGRMKYGVFFLYNVTGAVVWTVLFLYAGYVFGNVPVVRDNFGIVIWLIIALSLMPFIIAGSKRLFRHSRVTGRAIK